MEKPTKNELVQLTRKFADLLSVSKDDSDESIAELIEDFGKWASGINKITCQYALNKCDFDNMRLLFEKNRSIRIMTTRKKEKASPKIDSLGNTKEFP